MRIHLKPFLPAAIVACLGGAILWQASDGLRALTAESARRLKVEQQSVMVANVALTDFSGRKVSLSEGKVTLIEFIYTSCPTICQAAGDDFLKLRQQLKASRLIDGTRMLSISFDPERDNNEALAGYAELHGADGEVWTVARTDAQDLPGLLKTFGVTVIPDRSGGFQHNVAVHVVGREGRLAAIHDTGEIGKIVKTAEALR